MHRIGALGRGIVRDATPLVPSASPATPSAPLVSSAAATAAGVAYSSVFVVAPQEDAQPRQLQQSSEPSDPNNCRVPWLRVLSATTR